MKKIYSLILMFFCVFFAQAQTPDATLITPITLPASGTAINSGAYNQVVYNYNSTNVSTSSSTYTNCSGYTTGNTLRVANAAGFFEIVTANGNLNKIDVRIQSNATSAAVAFVAFSTNGTTYTNFSELTLPANNANPSCLSYTVTAPANSKYCRIARTYSTANFPGSTYTPIFVGSAQTIRFFELKTYVNPSTPTITTSITSLSGFTQTGATPSGSQSYTVSGTALTGTTVDLAAPTSYEISTDNATWGTTASLPVASGVISGQPKTIYTRLNDATAGAHAGNITHNSTGATQVNVALSGNTVNTPTITVSPTSLAFGNVLVGSTSTEQTYNVSGVLLTPAADNITITAPANYEISTTTGTGFGTSITLPYTGSTLSTTTIYVRLLPTAVATYNGNITNAGGGATTANVAVTGAGVLQAVGDYLSVASGSWDATATWNTWNGTAWVAAAAAPTAASTTNNVTIASGTTVTYNTGGRACKNVEVSGTLTATNLVNNLSYLLVYGNVKVNVGGTIGDVTNITGNNASGISLSTQGSGTQTITGGGNIYVSRLRINSANTVIIDNDMTINYHGSGNLGNASGLYPVQSGSTVTINAGKTVNMAPWSCVYLNTGSTTLYPYNFNLNINGSLIFMPGNVTDVTDRTLLKSYFLANTAAGGAFTTNVGSTGVLTMNDYYPNGSSGSGTATGTSSLNVASGGIVNVRLLADYSRNSTAALTGAGTFNLLGSAILKMSSPDGITASSSTGHIQTGTRNFSNTAIYSYEGTTPQVTGDGLPTTIGALVLNNAANTTLSYKVTATDSIKFINGKLILDAYNAATNIVKDATATNYAVSNAAGSLGINILTTPASYYFPVGPDATTFRPVTINFTTAPATPDALLVNAKQGDPGNAGLPLTETAVTPNSISLVSPLSWEIKPFSGFTGSFVYDATFTGNGTNNVLDYANTTLLKRNDALSNWEILGTHVATTGSNASPILSRTGFTSFSQFGIGGGAAILPVRLISFNASIKGTQVEQIWSSQNELNLNRYEVEISSDTRAFRKINTVLAYNNGTINNYSVLDNLATTTMFYRLKMIDNDGRYNYSNIVSINPKKLGTLNVFPNPVVNDLYVTYKTANENATLTITNLIGQIIYKTNVVKNTTHTTLQLANLTQGVYNIIYTNGTEKTNTIFIK